MTSTVEFTYLYNGFSLSINESALSRAVRVKNAVRDKIKRIYESKQVVANDDKVVSMLQVKESLIDLSQDKLINLNNVINALQTQQNVSYSVNRAVLFTQPLVAKIFRVTDRWFDGMPRVEKENAVSNDIPSVNMINHLGGEVVPGNWNNIEEKENVQENPLPLEPTLEAVPTVNTEEPVTSIEIPTSLGNTDVYNFDFNMESILPNLEPSVPNDAITGDNIDNNVSFDFVPEPKQIDSTLEKELTVSQTDENIVPSIENNDFGFSLPSLEPTISVEETTSVEMPVHETVPSVEQTVTSVNVTNSEREDRINDLLNKEFTPNPANNFVPEHVDNRSAELKIDDLLGRTTDVQQIAPEVTPVTLEEPVVNQVREDKPEITQGQVLARLKRFSNEMVEKDATISSLTAKNDALKEEVAVNKDKLSEYEVRVSDLSAKNSDLTSQNERLSARLEEAESSSKATIAKLEAKVTELTQSKSEELELLRKQLEDIKVSHASEIASMREKHATEIRLERESKDKQIQAIYATITDALGDTSMDDDYSKGMAA